MRAPRTDMWLPPTADKVERAKIVAIGGDGIGPETVLAALRVIEATGADVSISSPLHGKAALDEVGTAFPKALEEELRAADGILFGACDTAVGHAAPILIFIRFGLETYANLRPAMHVPAVPGRIGDERANLVVVRELTEGLYPGREGDLSQLRSALPDLKDHFGGDYPPGEGAFAIRVITERATRRVARYAARLARHRQERGYGPGTVTVVTKANVFRTSDGLFRRVCDEEIASIGGISARHLYVDEAARQMVACPEDHDVVVTSNLFGDILSDVSSEIMGGMPMCPSASIGESSAYFESCHGSAPDIAGQNKANPAATMLSAAMLLAHLGYTEEADRVTEAVFSAVADGIKTGDLGGTATTSSFTDAVCARVS